MCHPAKAGNTKRTHLGHAFNPFPTYMKSAADDFEIIKTKIWKNHYKWSFNSWLKLKTLWQQEKLLVLSNFSFPHNVFNKASVAEASERVCMWKRVNVRLSLPSPILSITSKWFSTSGTNSYRHSISSWTST